MADSSVESLSSSARLGQARGLIKVDDSLYVADGQQNCIWAIDRQGKISRRIGRSGRGPGEFGDISGIMKNSDHIFTVDISNARIQMFDLNFNLQTIFNHVISGNPFTSGKMMSVTDSLLFLSEGINDFDQLITVYQAAPPFDSLTSFHPRLIPPGMQPAAYNYVSIETNSRGDIAVTYTGLPYIFLYDNDYELQHVVYVGLPKEDLPDNPPIKPVDKPARTVAEAIGVTHLIGKPLLKDDGSLYFSKGSKLYFIRHQGNNKYQAEWIKYYTYANPETHKEKSSGIMISNFIIDEKENTVYLGSFFEENIYRFGLSK
ncbi:6-bladed beta-propeller [Fodinibius halophilus]|uniref:6-bladed beta-propeller n=1 Tax=Fodinibius halophilus TaxID=1736908 RepID=A0A6M1T864_9BACT|nr:6-bladed beta-propeller [Fodinibius halophilus]NGP90269.1 6-bladed beta-propeller [Fodinibius halophilus]